MKSSTLVNHARRSALTKEIYESWGSDFRALNKSRWPQAVWDAERACAAEFGAARGWAVTKKTFGLKTLGAGGVHLHNDYTVKHPVFDHVTYYRGGGPRNRRATAVVSQPYAVCFSAYDKVAERYGLNWQILENEGWYAVDAFCVLWTRCDGLFKPPHSPGIAFARTLGDCWLAAGELPKMRPGDSVWFYRLGSEL